jgi:hypothetical protein
MIKMPDDLAATAHLVGYEPLTLDEDQLNALSKKWEIASAYFRNQADWPKIQPGTVWDPQTSWVRGHDRPLDAFVDFYENYPRKHWYTVAAQAPPVAGALNNIAGIVVSHKRAAYQALEAAKNDLSRGGHLFGPKYLKVLGAHLYLPGVQGAYGEDVDADFATVDALREHLRQLNHRTQASIDAQAKIIEQAGAALDRVADNAAQATSVLPDGPLTVSSGAPSTYEHWVEFGR